MGVRTGWGRSEVRIGWGSNPRIPDGLGFESGGFEWTRVRIQGGSDGLGSRLSDRLGFGRGGPGAEYPSDRRPSARPTWRIERRQLTGSGVLCTPAPALRRLVLVQLRLPARRVLGARHGPSPGPPAALCLRQRRRPRNRGEITPPNDGPARGAAAGAGRRRGRASQPIGARARSATGQSQAFRPQPTAAQGGGVTSGRIWT